MTASLKYPNLQVHLYTTVVLSSIKEEFKFQNMTLNKGSITAGRANESDTEWLPVPEIETHDKCQAHVDRRFHD